MIELLNVTKQYPRTVALDNITITLDDKGIYGLLGRNGAGKTTLLKSIAGFIDINSGSIMVSGKKVTNYNMPEKINFIESRSTHFNMRIVDLINVAKNLQDDFDIEFAKKMIIDFKLDQETHYNQLSLGMQTMVTTLISLASNAKIVILDEPVLGFDSFMRAQFYQLLRESYDNKPRIIIVSTHLIDEIAKIVDSIIIIEKGRILLNASMNEIDEKAYSVTGMIDAVEPYKQWLNVIAETTIGGFKSLYVYDHRPDIVQQNVKIQPLGLQDFFMNLVGRE